MHIWQSYWTVIYKMIEQQPWKYDLNIYIFCFRCFLRQSSDTTTIAGVTSAILIVLMAFGIVISIFAFTKYRENRRLRDEIIELENETNRNLIEDNSANRRNDLPNEAPQ